ncbi:hypothetical protein GE09DRAFT_367044 [Coniochaeta sp. 2T2.1]|nr:hypothetical protein GE09DRAFT_367044 [Coniochaeta sp. 2T2.1]
MTPFSSALAVMAFALAKLGTVASYPDLDFFEVGYVCLDIPGHYMRCSNVPPARCCESGPPFCSNFGCSNCPQYARLFGYKNRGCFDAYSYCMETYPGQCCPVLGQSTYCTARWYTGCDTPRFRIGCDVEDPNDPYNTTAVTTMDDGLLAGGMELVDGMTEQYDDPIHPIHMHFVDAEGSEHDIYIPQEKFEQALEHFNKHEWVKLAKFEKWSGDGDQQYSEKDYGFGRERMKKLKAQEAEKNETQKEPDMKG